MAAVDVNLEVLQLALQRLVLAENFAVALAEAEGGRLLAYDETVQPRRLGRRVRELLQCSFVVALGFRELVRERLELLVARALLEDQGCELGVLARELLVGRRAGGFTERELRG